MSTMFILKLMPVLNAIRLKLNAKRGFTLIELLIVISIIAILVTIIVATMSGTQAKARDTRRKEDLDAVKKALELFKSDTTGSAKYPNTTTGSLVSNSYIKTLPSDPSITVNGGNYFYAPLTSAGAACPAGGGDTPVAASAGTCTKYSLIACLENLNDPNGVARPVAPANGSACPINRVYIVTEP